MLLLTIDPPVFKINVLPVMLKLGQPALNVMLANVLGATRSLFGLDAPEANCRMSVATPVGAVPAAVLPRRPSSPLSKSSRPRRAVPDERRRLRAACEEQRN